MLQFNTTYFDILNHKIVPFTTRKEMNSHTSVASTINEEFRLFASKYGFGFWWWQYNPHILAPSKRNLTYSYFVARCSFFSQNPATIVGLDQSPRQIEERPAARRRIWCGPDSPTRELLSRFRFRSPSRHRFMLITLAGGRLWNSKCSPQKHKSDFSLVEVRAYKVLSSRSSQKYLRNQTRNLANAR